MHTTAYEMRISDWSSDVCSSDLSAMVEAKHTIAQANAELDGEGSFVEELISAREAGEFVMAPREQITLMDVSPKQIVSAAASLIPRSAESRVGTEGVITGCTRWTQKH